MLQRLASLTLLSFTLLGGSISFISPPLQAAEPAPDLKAIGARAYDVVVYEGTPGGIACAVRAAREGLDVLLVNHTGHLGGMLTNGLCQWDALYDGLRSPIFAETVRGIDEHYRSKYGLQSPQYQMARFTMSHYPLSRFEPSVVERVLQDLVKAEKRITELRGYYPIAVERDGALLKSVELRAFDGDERVRVTATAFVDASYEADLAALAKVPYRVGREARDEFNEPHAGKLFTNIDKGPAPQDAVAGRLRIRPYSQKQGSIDPDSPATADRAVQAFNYRFCITNDPQNRRLPEKPASYNRDDYLNYDRKSMGGEGPNGKTTFNSPILPGENHDYAEADWPGREKIIRRHLDFALGLMYFLQNDESLSEGQRQKFLAWGLPLDEYRDNNNLPYEMYVRETRRIVGRHVFTEHDGSLASGLGRTPVHADSIAITDWYMDSHSCTTDHRPGYKYDGKLILTEESRPSMVPYRTLLPQGVDNLLVPVCLSATHIAWGAIRLEPVWMQTGEAAGFALALAAKQKVAPAMLDPEVLVRTLVEQRSMVAFFNDIDVTGKEPYIPAVQFLATRGFFSNYDARPKQPLGGSTSSQWIALFGRVRKRLPDDLTAAARPMPRMEMPNDVLVVASAFVDELRPLVEPKTLESVLERLQLNLNAPITRGDACRLMYELLKA